MNELCMIIEGGVDIIRIVSSFQGSITARPFHLCPLSNRIPFIASKTHKTDKPNSDNTSRMRRALWTSSLFAHLVEYRRFISWFIYNKRVLKTSHERDQLEGKKRRKYYTTPWFYTRSEKAPSIIIMIQ